MFSFRSLCFILLLFVTLGACRETSEQTHPTSKTTTSSAKKQVEVLVEAESFLESDPSISPQKDETSSTVQLSPGWLVFEVDIPQAGRYATEVKASASEESPVFWVEDYADNKDGRTYNITGDMRFSGTSGAGKFETLLRDGSPLNAGKHRMKLHVKDGTASIDWMKFRLIRPHTLTPKTLTQKTDGSEWTLVWSDEFDTDGGPDTSKWTYDIGDWGWGNNELQYYTQNRLENARCEDGNLIIEARKNDLGNPWTSARLTTRAKQSFLYGRIEFRAKVPPNKGNWAAGWTLGDEYVDEISWPYCGEIDILESVGYEMNDETGDGKAHSTIHCGAYYFKLGNQPTGILDVKDMHESFHTYSVDWTPEGIKAFVDGQQYFEYTDTANELTWPFSKPQNLILNLAMGGGWGGLQGMDESITSQQFVIDYVRVYELR